MIREHRANVPNKSKVNQSSGQLVYFMLMILSVVMNYPHKLYALKYSSRTADWLVGHVLVVSMQSLCGAYTVL